MKTPIIDAIRYAANGYIDPALEQFTHESPCKEDPEPDVLNALLDSLPLDGSIKGEIENHAVDFAGEWKTRGFRDGFRIAARLMLEILAAPETGSET